ncbi:MAG: hypothetical protein DWQ44_12270 [Bacteroidetes bacterium]|nr:MAG: hypothetical protein DWQ39_00415 [Bacteroidota bacterium]REK32259.1 MAG: hypothetical protein DWQ44_12270 [Bacteroidota bacterium]REK47411.1 MAG: hypothetical protein DWQ48_12840 [Bacteroidota bacterium]
MLALFKLLRIPNLILLGLSQVLVRFFLILPAFEAEMHFTGEMPEHMSLFNFALLVLSTVFIAAGGYIINDIQDIEIDKINKPGSNVAGNQISISICRKLYSILTITGIITGIYIAWVSGKPAMAGIHIFAALSLYVYATYFKKKLLSGNLIISSLAFLALFMVGLFEPEFYRNIGILFVYSIFAFGLTFLREVVKDIEDTEGDTAGQCKSLANTIGIRNTKAVLLIMTLLISSGLTYVLHKYFYTNSVVSFWLLLGMCLIPFAGLFSLIYSASEKKDYYYASLYTKFLMFAGVLSMIPLYYYFLT